VDEMNSRQGVRNVWERECNTRKECFQPCQGWGRGFESRRPLHFLLSDRSHTPRIRDECVDCIVDCIKCVPAAQPRRGSEACLLDE
jgi:hypothetical protein